jgi:putative ABC transport system permease protein
MNRPVPAYDELFDIQKKTKSAEAIAYRVGGRRTIKHKANIVENAIVSGCSYEFYKIKSFEISEGRYFTENEVNAGYNVAIVGNKIAEGLFPGNANPVGHEMRSEVLRIWRAGVCHEFRLNVELARLGQVEDDEELLNKIDLAFGRMKASLETIVFTK